MRVGVAGGFHGAEPRDEEGRFLAKPAGGRIIDEVLGTPRHDPADRPLLVRDSGFRPKSATRVTPNRKLIAWVARRWFAFRCLPLSLPRRLF